MAGRFRQTMISALPALGMAIVFLCPGPVAAADTAVSAAEQNYARFFAAPRIVGQEDEFCRRAYRIMLKGSRFCRDLYREWPTEPDCGYIGWGGHGEKEIEANIGMAHLYAMLITFGNYDEKVSGVSRAEALRRVRGVIRYCCFTHATGPHVCISGKRWGMGWHDASWASVLAHAAWLVWHDLDARTQEMVARVVTAEADRFVGNPPRSGKIDDTRAEDNAWNARNLAIALVMFPRHPHAERWREACCQYMMNTFSTAADRQDRTLIEGRPVAEWVTTENIHGDFTLENHRVIYPVYMWAGMSGLTLSAGYFVCAGREPPQCAFHHLQDVYGVYKKLQTWEGLPAYVNGSDKFLHLQVVDIYMHSFFAQVLGDRQAARIEQVELDILERLQARFTNGRVYPVEEVGEWSRVGNLGSLLGGSYLLHYVKRAPVEPVSAAEFDRLIEGVSLFPEGKFILHRTPEKLVSFAWSKPYRIMGLVIPRDGSWLVTPHPQGLVGNLVEEGVKREPPWKLLKCEATPSRNSFTVVGEALRCRGKVRHEWRMESPADNRVIIHHKLTAVKPVTLDRLEIGTIGFGRELGSDTVTLTADERRHVLGPPTGDKNEMLTFPEGEVVVGGRLRYEWKGSGTLTYVHLGRPVRVSGAPGGYGRVEDRLCVQAAGRRAEPGDLLMEGQAVITTLRPAPFTAEDSTSG